MNTMTAVGKGPSTFDWDGAVKSFLESQDSLGPDDEDKEKLFRMLQSVGLGSS